MMQSDMIHLSYDTLNVNVYLFSIYLMEKEEGRNNLEYIFCSIRIGIL